MTKQGPRQARKTRRNNRLEDSENDYENMTLKDYSNEFDKLVKKYQDENIYSLYENLAKLYEINESNLTKKIAELEEDAKAMQQKIYNDKITINQLIEDNDAQINEYISDIQKVNHEIKQLKEETVRGENVQRENNIKIKRLETEIGQKTRQEEILSKKYTKIQEEKTEIKLAMDALQSTIDEMRNQSQILNPHYRMSYDRLSYDSDTEEEKSFSFSSTINNSSISDGMQSFAEELEEYENSRRTNLNQDDTREQRGDNYGNMIEEISDTSEEEDITNLTICENPNKDIVNKKERKTNIESNNKKVTNEKTEPKQLFNGVRAIPLSPEIQIHVPKNLNISNERPKYININELEAQGNQDILTQIKLLDIEDQVKLNSIRMNKIEDKFAKLTNNQTEKTAKLTNNQIERENKKDKNPIKVQNTQKKTCVMIGDSHLRYIQEKMEENKQFSQGYTTQTHMKPGQGIEEICNMIPQNMKEDSVLVVCAGTNDIYKTKLYTFKEQIEKLAKLRHKVIIVSIPPQNCIHTNEDIIRLNTRIKYICAQYDNIEILNTHTFIKPQHLAIDGIHMSRKAKIWMSTKLVSMIGDKRTRTINNTNNMSENRRHTNQKGNKEYQSGEKAGIWENGRFIPHYENQKVYTDNRAGRWEDKNFLNYYQFNNIQKEEEWPIYNGQKNLRKDNKSMGKENGNNEKRHQPFRNYSRPRTFRMYNFISDSNPQYHNANFPKTKNNIPEW
uniref:Uncharacterized protein n=2 Tax=Cacopsylla melanoneura TaxID=428564 RepID=A0A8D9BZ07_9HEMI